MVGLNTQFEVVAERLKTVINKEEQLLAASASGRLTNEAMMQRLQAGGREFVE